MKRESQAVGPAGDRAAPSYDTPGSTLRLCNIRGKLITPKAGTRVSAGPSMGGAVRIAVLWVVFVCVVVFPVTVTVTVSGAPVRTSFEDCKIAEFTITEDLPIFRIQCCPKLPATSIIDGLPPPSTSVPRVRPAAQCTDAAYAAKLQRGYELMRALPDDDPRSFKMQWKIHCAYCGGAFNNPTGRSIEDGLSIHPSWHFYPWHRLFMYFHERILQSLLGDPTFSLSYWNWDNPLTIGNGVSDTGACLRAGHDFPAAYISSSASTYDANRSDAAKGMLHYKFPDLSYVKSLTPEEQPHSNVSREILMESNRNVMYQVLVSGSTTTTTFLGVPYSFHSTADHDVAAGLLAYTAHTSVHFWTGNQRPPDDTYDMGGLVFSARDPVFYTHHGNLDRLWEVWKTLGGDRVDFSDPDFLDTEFLFFDENKDLRRVKIRDSLDTRNLGYVYQGANDAAWLDFRPSRCSTSKYHDLVTHVESLQPPVRESDGYYRLRANSTPFVMMVDRLENPLGAEEFLVISGISTDMSRTAGFDVFINFPELDKHEVPHKCAEYRGRFANMAESRRSHAGRRHFAWKESIARTVVDLQAPPAPSKLLVTIVPLAYTRGDFQTVAFTSIKIVTKEINLDKVSSGGSTDI